MTQGLERFLRAQEGTYEVAAGELESGKKQSHWMWYIFPQIAGLGYSEMAQRYAIADMNEARAYAAHPLLGHRLEAITKIVNDLPNPDIEEVFGWPDYMKFHSCMTLFNRVLGGESVFSQALEKHFSGKEDTGTLKQLEAQRCKP